MEEVTEIIQNQWYVREWDNAFFYCEKIFDKYIEGHGFINNQFDGTLHFESHYFKTEFKITTSDYIEDYFDSI